MSTENLRDISEDSSQEDAYQTGSDLDTEGIEDSRNLFNAASQAYDEKRPGAVVTLCTQALDIDNLNIAALNLRGMAYQRLGNIQAAQRDFQNVLDIDSEHADAHDNMGNILYDQAQNEQYEAAQGLYQEALGHFYSATAQDPEHQEAFFHAGKTLVVLFRENEALSYFNQALFLDPTLEEDIDAFWQNTMPHDLLGNEA